MSPIEDFTNALHQLCGAAGIDLEKVEIRLPYGDYRKLEMAARQAAGPSLIRDQDPNLGFQFRLNGVLYKPTEIPRAYQAGLVPRKAWES